MKSKSLKWLNEQIESGDTPKSTIELINFIIKCVKEYKTEEKIAKTDINPFFNKLWEIYPKRVSKQTAFKTFEHKLRGLNEEECKEKCNKIYKLQILRQRQWESEGRDKQYIPNYSTFLNSEVPNSKFFKGR